MEENQEQNETQVLQVIHPGTAMQANAQQAAVGMGTAMQTPAQNLVAAGNSVVSGTHILLPHRTFLDLMDR